MIAVHLYGLLGRLTRYPAGEIDQRMRPLRECGLIPSGGRGPHAARIEPAHIGYIMSCMASRRAVDAAEIGVKVMDLKRVYDGPADVETAFGPVLMMAVVCGEDLIRRLEIASDGTSAWAAVVDEGIEQRWLFASESEIDRRGGEAVLDEHSLGDAICGHYFVYGPEAIQSIHVMWHQSQAARRQAGGEGEG